MADWSHLPNDLLQEIQTHLSSPFYTVRFRSVCSTWHCSIQFNGHNHLPPSISHLFSKRSIFLLSPPPAPDCPKPISWIVKIDQITPQRFNLFYPLSKTRVYPLPKWFPRVLDLINTRICELGLEFSYHGTSILGDCSFYTEKVAYLPRKNDDGDGFLFLTIHVSGKLAVFTDVSMQWKLIDQFDSLYDDVIGFDGEFYAVDNLGRAVVVVAFDLVECDVRVVAPPICGGDKKRLVEMDGELMLVDVYMGHPPFLGDHYEEGVDGRNNIGLGESIALKSMWFKVFRLDREGMKWVEVKDLGNNVLFLGVNTAFSASADDLYWDKGNCICFNFPQRCFRSVEDGDDQEVKYNYGGVYDLEDGSISFADMFWPPPSWITS